MRDELHYQIHMKSIADRDVRETIAKDTSYGGSWQKSGGRSAWFMLLRKMDRLQAMLSPPAQPTTFSLERAHQRLSDVKAGRINGELQVHAPNFEYLVESLTSQDIFRAIEARPGGADGTPLAEIRDLRRYLLLVEAYAIDRGWDLEPDEVVERFDNDALSRQVDAVMEQVDYLEIPLSSRPKSIHAIREKKSELKENKRPAPITHFDGTPAEDSNRHASVPGDDDLIVAMRSELKDRRLFSELNTSEYNNLFPLIARYAYDWHENENKWRMRPKFREAFGR